MSTRLELIVDRERDAEEQRAGIALRSPEVGLFTCTLSAGALVAPRTAAGVLHSLGRRFDLVVPAEVAGRVVNEPPERVLAPVAYGIVLYELEPLAATAGATARASTSEHASAALVFRAPYSGRFWQRPAPNEPEFLRAGDVVADGQTVGLLEVMKTFTHLVYRAQGALPAHAKLVRYAVADGGEVRDGGALLELEPA